MKNKKEKIINIMYGFGEVNPTILTNLGRILKAVPTSIVPSTHTNLAEDGTIQASGYINYEWKDITPKIEIISIIKQIK